MPSGPRVVLIRTGSVLLPPGYVFREQARNLPQALGRGVPPSAMIPAPIGAALVEHPDAGPVLVDTGMHPVVATNPRANLGVIGAAIARVRMGPEENVPAQLRRRGIDPCDVRQVVMTHLHPDHTSAMSEFPSATFHVTREEWRAATARLGPLRGYIKGHLPDESRVSFADVRGGEPHDGLERTLDLLGDGSMRLVWTPGHTAGHVSVLLATPEGPLFYLADAVYTLRNLWEDALPWRTTDDEASLDSMAQIRAYARAHPDVPLIPTHDAAAWATHEPHLAENIPVVWPG